jgi:hypothetical protein
MRLRIAQPFAFAFVFVFALVFLLSSPQGICFSPFAQTAA